MVGQDRESFLTISICVGFSEDTAGATDLFFNMFAFLVESVYEFVAGPLHCSQEGPPQRGVYVVGGLLLGHTRMWFGESLGWA